MRANNLAIYVLAAAAALPACKWTEFDDLEKETWVEATTKPGEVKSGDYGLAIARGAQASTDGGRLVVIGTNSASYSELQYSAQGDTSVPATKLDLEVQYGIANISSTTSILITNPTNDDVSLLAASDNGIAMLTGSAGTLKLYQFFNVAAPDAATYMTPGSKGTALPIVAVGATVYGGFLPALAQNMAQPSCALTGLTKIRALGAAPSGTSDDLLAWDESGKLYQFNTTVFDGCSAAVVPVATLDVGFKPGAGSRIVPIDATHVLLVGQNGNAGFLAEAALSTGSISLVGSGVNVAGLASAAVLTVTGLDSSVSYVVAGEPTASVSGTVAGQVELYPLTVSGVGATPVANLHDAQPEGGQEFGRSVAVLPFNGEPVIAVSANNEIFTYFRANLADGTTLYPETRQGQ